MDLDRDFDRFVVALAAMAEVLNRGRALSEVATMLWYQTLERFDIEQVEKAFRVHLETPGDGKWMPMPSDLIAVIEGTKTDRALIAWTKVHEAMAWPGAYTDVCFDDPIIHVVIGDLGGWVKVCRTPVDELSYLSHRFGEAYRAYAPKSRQLVFPRSLRGDRMSDDCYLMARLPLPKTKPIGDKKVARWVFENGSADGSRGLLQGVMASPYERIAAMAPAAALEAQRG